jgi:hypothetical protein
MSPHSSDNLWENIKVARPCKVTWDEMEGSERARVCGRCLNYVFDIADVPNDAAENLIQDSCGSKALSAFRRSDGKLMISDCPRGRGSAASKLARGLGVALAGSLVLFGFWGFFASKMPTIEHDHDVACPNCYYVDKTASEAAPVFRRVIATKTLPAGHKIGIGDVQLLQTARGAEPPSDDSFFEPDTGQLIDLETTTRIQAGTTIKAHHVKRFHF